MDASAGCTGFCASVWAELCCSVTGKEAHQRLLPQPHVPSSAAHQPRGRAGILPPHPVLPCFNVNLRGCVGLLLTPVLYPQNLPILTSKPNTRQSKQGQILLCFYFVLLTRLSEPFLSSFVVFYMFVWCICGVRVMGLRHNCESAGSKTLLWSYKMILIMDCQRVPGQNTNQLTNNHALPLS